MKFIYLVVLSVLLVGCGGTGKVKRSISGIDGAVISGGKVVAKQGYKFVDVSSGRSDGKKVVALMNRAGVIDGQFSCGCSSSSGAGGCVVQTIGNTISCIATVCKSCAMRTTIGSTNWKTLELKQ